jgi:hypothetical protein
MQTQTACKKRKRKYNSGNCLYKQAFHKNNSADILEQNQEYVRISTIILWYNFQQIIYDDILKPNGNHMYHKV